MYVFLIKVPGRDVKGQVWWPWDSEPDRGRGSRNGCHRGEDGPWRPRGLGGGRTPGLDHQSQLWGVSPWFISGVRLILWGKSLRSKSMIYQWSKVDSWVSQLWGVSPWLINGLRLTWVLKCENQKLKIKEFTSWRLVTIVCFNFSVVYVACWLLEKKSFNIWKINLFIFKCSYLSKINNPWFIHGLRLILGCKSLRIQNPM